MTCFGFWLIHSHIFLMYSEDPGRCGAGYRFIWGSELPENAEDSVLACLTLESKEKTSEQNKKHISNANRCKSEYIFVDIEHAAK